MDDLYKIQKGDTLTSISRSRGSTVRHLAEVNGIADPDVIYAGETLVVPSAPSVMSYPPEMPATPNIGPSSSGTLHPSSPPEMGPIAQPKAPSADNKPTAPPGALSGVSAGEISSEDKSDQRPDDPICNCPDDEKKEPDGKVRLGGDENIDVVYAEATGDAEQAGVLGNAEGQVGLGMTRADHAGNFGNSPFGGSHKVETFSADAAAEGGVVHGVGGKAKASARMVKHGGSLFLGSDQNNPVAELGGEYELLSTEAKGNVLIGSDGNRAGIGGGFGLEATAAKASAEGEIGIPIPFTDWSIVGRGKGGVMAGSAALGGNAQAFKNLETGRYHIGLAGKAAALLGLDLDVDLSVGPRYEDRLRPDGP